MRGQLLIAGATLPDPNFARTVVLVCEHSDDGALGLVLNRPGELVVGESAPELATLTGDEATIDRGGPVQPDALLVLAGRRHGRFGPAATFPVGLGPRVVAVLDVDRDGRRDLAVANRESDSVSVLLNTSRAALSGSR